MWEMKSDNGCAQEMEQWNHDVRAYEDHVQEQAALSRGSKGEEGGPPNSCEQSWINVSVQKCPSEAGSVDSRRRAVDAMCSFAQLQSVLMEKNEEIDDATWAKVSQAHQDLMATIAGKKA